MLGFRVREEEKSMAKFAMIVKGDLTVEFEDDVILNAWIGEIYEIIGETQGNHADYWVVGCQVGYRGLTTSNVCPFCIKKSNAVVMYGIENIVRSKMELLEMPGYDGIADASIAGKIVVKCRLCGQPQEPFVLEDMRLNSEWMYVCNECISTKEYWEGTRTDAVNGYLH